MPLRSPWEVHYKTKEMVGANMAEFALGSLSTMVSQNPAILIGGTIPFLSSRLLVSWGSLDTLLACVMVEHFAVSVVTYWAEPTDSETP